VTAPAPANPAADAFWSDPATATWSVIGDPKAFAVSLLGVCGGGSVLDVGCGSGRLMAALREHGVRVQGIDISPAAVERCNAAAPGSASVGDALAIPFPADAFDTVVCAGLPSLLDADLLATLLAEARRVARCAVVIVAADPASLKAVHGGPEGAILPIDRARIDEAAFDAGLRRHPLAMRLVSFGQLEQDPFPRTMVYERVPDRSLGEFDRDWLERSRLLHMDHLRATGRRADAHLARYHLACDCVRAGDRVLDAACGMGYGTRMLACASAAERVLGADLSTDAIRYAAANHGSARAAFTREDATQLDSVGPGSVDFIASFETLEHVPDPEAMLERFHDALSPGGRLIVSVPNMWVDEQGVDPNPHHLHVYSREKVLSQLSKRFIVERVWRQIAGNGFKLADRARTIEAVDLSRPEPEAEWWLVLAMKSPDGATKENFRERMFPASPSGTPGYNLSEFARDYDNPALLRSMISIGPRLSDDAALAALAGRTLETARPGSPDHGAAACVLAYQAMSAADVGVRRQAIERLDAFAAAHDGTPHAQRWVVSGEYVAAKLSLANGDRADALRRFRRCAAMDATVFSPLLGTKTVDAACRVGMLLAMDGRVDEAREAWVGGIREARRLAGSSWLNVVGDERTPQPYGLHELAQVVDAASHCAGWLDASNRLEEQPGFAWVDSTRQTFGDTRGYVRDLLAAKAWLESMLAAAGDGRAMQDQLARAAEQVQALCGERDWLRTQVANYRQAASDLDAGLAKVRDWARELEGARDWHQAQAEHWRQDAQSVRGAMAELEKARDWNADQAANWRAEAQARAAAILTLRATAAELEKARDWNAAQATNWRAEAEARGRAVDTLRATVTELEKARDWNVGQASNWRTEAEARGRVLETLRATVTELEKARDWNVGQVANWREEAEVRARTIESLKAAASELEQARERERHEAAAAAEVLRQEIERGRAREANLEARISADAAELAAARRRIDDLLKRGLVDRVLNRPL
jgi:SAM-dependent methyltransferase/uncharacterized coiled-coil DUF342 family protein